VVFIEGEMLYNTKGEVPEGEFTTPLGVADVKRAGTAVTVVAHSKTVTVALRAADELAREGIAAEVVDPRTIRPLDVATLAASVRKTNRCVIVEEGWPFAGVGAQIAYDLQREVFDDLDAPIVRVTGADVPMPYNKQLERLAKPDAARVVTACKQVLYQA
jgi:pyruvate dehydrogenase E1 component beta subunit